jgi:SAM-dependent methyltransferase
MPVWSLAAAAAGSSTPWRSIRKEPCWASTSLAPSSPTPRDSTGPICASSCNDIMHVDELAETFDGVACLDTALYLPDKALAIARLSRVVEPGGRLLLVDWCRQEGLSAVQEELVLHPFMR